MTDDHADIGPQQCIRIALVLILGSVPVGDELLGELEDAVDREDWPRLALRLAELVALRGQEGPEQ